MTKIPTNLPAVTTDTTQGTQGVGQVASETGVDTPAAANVESTHVPQTVAQNPLDPQQSLRRDSGTGLTMLAMEAGAKMDADWADLGSKSHKILNTLGRMDNDTLNELFDDWNSDRVWTA